MEEVYIVQRLFSYGWCYEADPEPEILAVFKTITAAKRYIQKCIDKNRDTYLEKGHYVDVSILDKTLFILDNGWSFRILRMKVEEGE